MHNLCKGFFIMAEKSTNERQQYALFCENSILTVKGVKQVIEISEREAQLKLNNNTLFIKGNGLNVTKLDKEQGVVVMEYSSLSGLTFRQGGMTLKGLFR